jgi:signal transduction histidine kinase
VYRKIHPEINYIFTSNRDECYYDFDKIQLEQVVDNLLNNAEKFVSKSDPKISIDIQVSHTEILISIADNGIGFQD